MVKHQKCHGVGDVEKFLNGRGMSLKDVQITYAVSKFGGDYYVFYEEPVLPKKEMTVDGEELILTPVDQTHAGYGE